MSLAACRNVMILLALALCIFSVSVPLAKQHIVSLPEFTQSSSDAWINSLPLRVSDLQGKVVMLDVWTYGCWNCYRSIPWMLTLEERFSKKDFQIIGIHSPEFDHEHDRENVIAKMQEFKITHPVMMDNDFGYWKALGNRYWPTFYIVDRQGNIQGIFIGETHADSARATQMESLIMQLLQ